MHNSDKSKIIFLCFFLIAICLTSLSALEGKVIEVFGKVEIKKGDAWVALKSGDPLVKGSVISTGFKSEAVISFDETIITVKALTRLSVEKLLEKNGDKSSAVYLDAGSIAADVKHAENKRVGFTVKSPVATASVRGTNGIVHADGSVIGIDGKWAIGAPEARTVPLPSVKIDEKSDFSEKVKTILVNSGLSSSNGMGNISDKEQIESDSSVSRNDNPDVSSDNDNLDLSFPDDPGLVYVNPGEKVVIETGNIVPPQQVKAQTATSNKGVKTLSAVEAVKAPIVQSSADSEAKVNQENKNPPVEVEKTGTVKVVINFPE